jgi:hypothetical protein
MSDFKIFKNLKVQYFPGQSDVTSVALCDGLSQAQDRGNFLTRKEAHLKYSHACLYSSQPGTFVSLLYSMHKL